MIRPIPPPAPMSERCRDTRVDRSSVGAVPAHRIRFAFTIPSGPQEGWTCGGWRVWTHNNDLYITTKDLGGMWKVSLHDEVAWRVAMTKEHANTPGVVVPGDDRAVWKFDPPPYEDGVQWAFAIVATRSCLRPNHIGADELQLPASDDWVSVNVASLWITEPWVEITSDAGAVAEPLPLANGRSVWMTFRVEHGTPIEPEPIPVSAMIEPQIPGQHEVPVPSLLVRGVHVG